MRKPTQKKSIISNTTTCPYCGHRVLHKNLEKHIRSQHPVAAEDQVFFRKIHKPKPASCPYCDLEVELAQLEEHIHDHHLTERRKAAERVDARIEKEEHQKQEKLTKIARRYKAEIVKDKDFDGTAPWEWRLAREKSKIQEQKLKELQEKADRRAQRRAKRLAPKPASNETPSGLEKDDPDWISCPECGAQLKAQNLEKHMQKAHPSPPVPQKTNAARPSQRDVVEIVYCPVCDRPFSQGKLPAHLATHGSEVSQ